MTDKAINPRYRCKEMSFKSRITIKFNQDQYYSAHKLALSKLIFYLKRLHTAWTEFIMLIFNY